MGLLGEKGVRQKHEVQRHEDELAMVKQLTQQSTIMGAVVVVFHVISLAFLGMTIVYAISLQTTSPALPNIETQNKLVTKYNLTAYYEKGGYYNPAHQIYLLPEDGIKDFQVNGDSSFELFHHSGKIEVILECVTDDNTSQSSSVVLGEGRYRMMIEPGQRFKFISIASGKFAALSALMPEVETPEPVISARCSSLDR